MTIGFSNTSTLQGIAEQARSFMRVDSTQYPVAKIVASANNWLDRVTSFAIGADRRFQWDNTNQTKLPEGTTDLTINQSDYSFLTDEQGNTILTLTGVSRLLSGSNYEPLHLVDRNDSIYDPQNFGITSGTPTMYDKIADNIIRIDTKPPATVSAGLKFFFQRTSPYFTSASTTATTGFSPLLDRGFVIACAYDGALTLGLDNLQALSVELAKEEKKLMEYFSNRNNDDDQTMTMKGINFR